MEFLNLNKYLNNFPREKKIKILGTLLGINWAEVARKIGVTRVAIYRTISGEIKSKRLRKAIADALHIPYSELWNEEK